MMADPESSIKELETQAQRLEDEMKYELFKIRRNAKKIVFISLFAGAGALSAVTLTKLLSKEKEPPQVAEKKKKSKSKIKAVKEKPVFTSRIKTAAMAILMEIGREKMMDFLKRKFDDTKPSK